PLSYGEDEGEVFLGHSVTQRKQVSDGTAHTIDEEVRAIIDANYNRAKEILTQHIDKLHAMAEALMKYETIDREQIDDIMNGRPPRPPRDWTDTRGGPRSDASDAPSTDGAPEPGFGRPASDH